MNLFDLITKDIDTLREAHREAVAYAEAMTAAQIEFTDKVIAIANKHGMPPRQAIRAAVNEILDELLDGVYDKEATK